MGKLKGKMKRRAEMQTKYCWPHPRPLSPGTVRTITTYISDYSNQETILEWMGYNKDICGNHRVWSEFLDYVEKNPDVPVEGLLDTLKNGYPMLEGHNDQRFWAAVLLLQKPGGLEKLRQERMSLEEKAERNSDALCWTCTNLDYDPIYEQAPPQSTQPVAGLWNRDTSILDHDPVDETNPMHCQPLPVCPVRGVVIHKGYKHCSSYSENASSSTEES